MLLDAFAAGLGDAHSQVKAYTLNEVSIEHCRSCFACMLTADGKCVIHDGMEPIYGDLRTSDALIIGTPLYTDTMSSRTKVFFDRCIASLQPFVRQDSQGRTRHPPAWRMPKRAVLVSTCAFPEPENFKVLRATIRALCRTFDSEFTAGLCVPGSIVLQMDKTLLGPHLELLRQAGKKFGDTGTIPRGLAARINTPVLSKEAYLRQFQGYEDWCKKHRK
jgi:hypothetical protein